MKNDQSHRANDIVARVKLVHYDSMFSIQPVPILFDMQGYDGLQSAYVSGRTIPLVRSETHIYADISSFHDHPRTISITDLPIRGATYVVVLL